MHKKLGIKDIGGLEGDCKLIGSQKGGRQNHTFKIRRQREDKHERSKKSSDAAGRNENVYGIYNTTI